MVWEDSDAIVDTFRDAIDDTVTLEVIDNGDNAHVVINLMSDNGDAVGIALTPAQAHALARALNALAAGIIID